MKVQQNDRQVVKPLFSTTSRVHFFVESRRQVAHVDEQVFIKIYSWNLRNQNLSATFKLFSFL